jgi:hypothetical protein
MTFHRELWPSGVLCTAAFICDVMQTAIAAGGGIPTTS